MVRRTAAEGGSRRRGPERRPSYSEALKQMRKDAVPVAEYLVHSVRAITKGLKGIPSTYQQEDFLNTIKRARVTADALVTNKLHELHEPIDTDAAVLQITDAFDALLSDASHILHIELPDSTSKMRASRRSLSAWMREYGNERTEAPTIPTAERVDWGEPEDLSPYAPEVNELFERPREAAHTKESIEFRMAGNELMRTEDLFIAHLENEMRGGIEDPMRTDLVKKTDQAAGNFRTARDRFIEAVRREKGDTLAGVVRIKIAEEHEERYNRVMEQYLHLPQMLRERAKDTAKRADMGTAFAFALSLVLAGGMTGGYIARHQAPTPEQFSTVRAAEPRVASRRREAAGMSLSGMIATPEQIAEDARQARAEAPVTPREAPREEVAPDSEPVVIEPVTIEPVMPLADQAPIEIAGIGGEDTTPVEPDTEPNPHTP